MQGLALNTAMGSDPILESSQCKRLGSTVASKSHNGHGRTTKEKLEPDPSNQVGPAYAYKVDHDHGAAGSHGPRCPWSVPFIAKTAVRHRAVMHKATNSGQQSFEEPQWSSGTTRGNENQIQVTRSGPHVLPRTSATMVQGDDFGDIPPI